MHELEVYDHVISSMNRTVDYGGTAHQPLLEAMNTHLRWLHETRTEVHEPRLSDAKAGLLQGQWLVLARYSSGLYEHANGEPIGGIILLPFPRQNRPMGALYERNRQILALNTTPDRASHTLVADLEERARVTREDLFEDLGIRSTPKRSRAELGIEIAVRYLLETPSGLPIGIGPGTD